MTVEIKTCLEEDYKALLKVYTTYVVANQDPFNGSYSLVESEYGNIVVTTTWVFKGRNNQPDGWWFNPLGIDIKSNIDALNMNLTIFFPNKVMGVDGNIYDYSYSGSVHAATGGALTYLKQFIGFQCSAFETCKKVREYLVDEYIMDTLKPSLYFKEVEI